MRLLLRLSVLLFGLLAAPSAWAAACSGTAFANGSGGSPFVWSGATTWVTTSGGGTNCTLTTGNAVVFDNNTAAGTYELTGTISVASLTSSAMVIGQANTVFITWTGGTLTISGNLFFLSPNICLSGGTTVGTCTSPVTSGRALSFTSTSGTTNITTNPVAGASGTNQLPTVTFNGSGGTFELLDNAILQGNVTFTAGTLDATTNNTSPTLGGTFTVPAVGILNCGTGTWTFSGTSGVLFGNTAGATVSCASATITFSTAANGGNRGFNSLNTQSYGTINVSGSGATTPSSFSFGSPGAGGSVTFAALNFTNLASSLLTNWGSNGTVNITAQPTTWNGTKGNFLAFLNSPNQVATTFNLGTSHPITPIWMEFCNVTFSGTSSTVTATNSIDMCGNNNFNGGSISAPGFGGGGIIGG